MSLDGAGMPSSNGISAIVCLREVSKRSDAEQRQRIAQMVRDVDGANTAGRSNDLRTEIQTIRR